MSNRRRVAERNLGVFLNPGGAASEGGYLVPMDNLNVGPGKPGPGDEWNMPPAPLDEVAGQDGANLDPEHSDGTLGSPRRPTRGA